MIHVERACRQCGSSFTVTLKNHVYCSHTCRLVAQRRTCKLCHRVFIDRATVPRKFCSNECRLKAGRAHALEGARRVKIERGRTLVECAWSECPKRDELISTVRSKMKKRHFHGPECREAWKDAGGHDGRLREGAVLACKKCGAEIGYRPPGQLEQEYCGICSRSLRGGVKVAGVSTAFVRRCALCDVSVTRTASQGRRQKNAFCSPDHYTIWRQRRSVALKNVVDVQCVVCATSRTYRAGKIPRTVDCGTLTWTCPSCRTYKSGVVSLVCSYARCGKSFKAAILLANRDRDHFCSAAHRTRHYHETRVRTLHCQRCDSIIQRRGVGKFCTRACYVAERTGQTRPTSLATDAEQRILLAWQANVRGVRALARASGASVNTVRKLIAAGKMVEPAAARSA